VIQLISRSEPKNIKKKHEKLEALNRQNTLFFITENNKFIGPRYVK